jgi:hypothetical protein
VGSKKKSEKASKKKRSRRPTASPRKKSAAEKVRRKHLLLLEVETDLEISAATVLKAVNSAISLGEQEAQGVADDTGCEESERLLAAYVTDLNIEVRPHDYRLLKLARDILAPFEDSSLYEDYQQADGWTNEQFNEMLGELAWQSVQSPEDPGTDEVYHICQNCQQIWGESELINPIPKLHERVAPGEPMPSGVCPRADCGALCQPMSLEESQKP